jgi:hypothetical protein
LVCERLQERDLSIGERSDFVVAHEDAADRLAGPHQRRREHRAVADNCLKPLRRAVLRVRFGEDVLDMDHASTNDGPPGHRVPRDSGAPTTVYRQWPVGRRDLQPFAVKSADHGVVGVAELRRLFGDGVEHGVEVGRLRGDHAQDLGGCRLLLQGLGQHSLGPNRSFGGGGLPLLRFGEPRLELRDPRVAIVRHHVHPSRTALLFDGARIARGPNGPL